MLNFKLSRKVRAFAGSSNVRFGTQRESVPSNQFRHPGYRPPKSAVPDLGFDIALLKLDRPYSQLKTETGYFKINPMCLPQYQEHANDDYESTVLFGYGTNGVSKL